MNNDQSDKKNKPLRADDPLAYEGWEDDDDSQEYRRKPRKPRKSEW